MCQMYGLLSPDCSTKHIQKVGTRKLSADCDADGQSFGNKIAPGTFNHTPSRDFRDMLGAWSIATGLNSGISSGNNSLVHVLSQLVVTNKTDAVPNLNKTMPSLAEGLAVLSNSMLMKGAINTTFDNRIIKPAPIPAITIPYDVLVQTQQYRSGPPAPWTGILYPILFIMFVADLYCLTYFLREMGLVVDFLEPRNLFSVAIASPDESERRTTGQGPIGNHVGVSWMVERDHDRRLVFRKAGARRLVVSEKISDEKNMEGWI